MGPELKQRFDESDWLLDEVRYMLEEEVHERRMDRSVALMERSSNSDRRLADVRCIYEEACERRMEKLEAFMERSSNMEARIEMSSRKMDKLCMVVMKAIPETREVKPPPVLKCTAPEVPVPEETEPVRRQEVESAPSSPPPSLVRPPGLGYVPCLTRGPRLRTRLKRNFREFFERQRRFFGLPVRDLREWLRWRRRGRRSDYKRYWFSRRWWKEVLEILILFGIGLWVVFWTISQINGLYGK